jgi:DNA adenine methylase
VKYLGGKNQIAEWIAEQVLARTVSRQRYVEPFVGSAAIWMRLAPTFPEAVGSDAMPDLVLYLNAIRDGWLPPARITEDDYEALRHADPSPLRGHVGFNVSWGGMWFRGYGGYEGRDRQGMLVSRAMGRRLKRCPPVSRSSYLDVSVHAGDVIYCDPPYAGTEPYRWIGKFCSYEFWGRAIEWVRAGAEVVVSEETAPRNWVEVTSVGRKALAAYTPRSGRLDRDRTERVFVHESQVADLMTLDTHARAVRDGRRQWPAIE